MYQCWEFYRALSIRRTFYGIAGKALFSVKMVLYAKYHKATDLKTIYSFFGSRVANMLLPVLHHRVTPHTCQTVGRKRKRV
jgi:hypothetical protein